MPLHHLSDIPTDQPAVIVDADGLIYRALNATQTIWDDEPLADLPAAHDKFAEDLDGWCGQLKGPRYLALTPGGKTHRYRIYPDYKGNRTEDSRPTSFHEFRKEIEDRYPVVMVRGLEADDVCGILGSYRPDVAVVSPDKDMATLPCTWVQPGKGTHRYDECAANLNWLRQGLTGDMTDNYPGLPNIGPKKAEKILPRVASLEVLWEVYCRAYEAHGFTEDDAVVMARLARILRPEDYDQSTGKVLWEAPKRLGPDEPIPDYSFWLPKPPRTPDPGPATGNGEVRD